MGNKPARFYGPAQPGTVAATLVTAPSEQGIIIRNIHVANTTATAATLTLSVGTDAVGTRLYATFSVPANGIHDSGATFEVLNGGETIQGFQGTSGALTVSISGEVYSP
mgnify:FL=1